MCSCFNVFGALVQCGQTGPEYSTLNGLGYTESKAKSSIPHLAPSEVFRWGSNDVFCLSHNHENLKRLSTFWSITYFFCQSTFSIKK